MKTFAVLLLLFISANVLTAQPANTLKKEYYYNVIPEHNKDAKKYKNIGLKSCTEQTKDPVSGALTVWLEHFYDTEGRLTSELLYSKGVLTDTYEYSYDLSGNLIWKKDFSYSRDLNSNTTIEECFYDTLNRPVHHTLGNPVRNKLHDFYIYNDSLNSVSWYIFDQDSTLLSKETRYFDNNNKLTRFLIAKNSGSLYRWDYAYISDTVKITEYDNDTLQNETYELYDASGEIRYEKIVQPDGSVCENVKSKIDSAGYMISKSLFSYDCKLAYTKKWVYDENRNTLIYAVYSADGTGRDRYESTFDNNNMITSMTIPKSSCLVQGDIEIYTYEYYSN